MHARHVTLHIKPGRIDDAAAILESRVLPVLREQDGFRGAGMFTETSSGHGVIVILWDRAEDCLRLEAAGFYQLQIAKFADVFAQPPAAKLLEVRVCTFGVF